MTPALCPWSWPQGVRHARVPRDHKREAGSSEHRATVMLNSIYRVKGLYKITALREISKWCLETKQSVGLRCMTVYWGAGMYRVSRSPIRSKRERQRGSDDWRPFWWSNVLRSLITNTNLNPSRPANSNPARRRVPLWFPLFLISWSGLDVD